LASALNSRALFTFRKTACALSCRILARVLAASTTGEVAVEAARLAQAAGKPGFAALDARGGIHLGLFPSRGGHRNRSQPRCEWETDFLAFHQPQLGQRRPRISVSHRQKSKPVCAVATSRCAMVPIAASPRPPITSRAKVLWMNWPRRPAPTRWNFGWRIWRIRDSAPCSKPPAEKIRLESARQNQITGRRYRPRVRDGKRFLCRGVRGNEIAKNQIRVRTRLPGVRMRRDCEHRQFAQASERRDHHGAWPGVCARKCASRTAKSKPPPSAAIPCHATTTCPSWTLISSTVPDLPSAGAGETPIILHRSCHRERGVSNNRKTHSRHADPVGNGSIARSLFQLHGCDFRRSDRLTA